MLRRAEEIFNELWVEHNSRECNEELHLFLSPDEIYLVESAINNGRKELLQECISRTIISDNNFHPEITKEDLEKMLTELK